MQLARQLRAKENRSLGTSQHPCATGWVAQSVNSGVICINCANHIIMEAHPHAAVQTEIGNHREASGTPCPAALRVLLRLISLLIGFLRLGLRESDDSFSCKSGLMSLSISLILQPFVCLSFVLRFLFSIPTTSSLENTQLSPWHNSS